MRQLRVLVGCECSGRVRDAFAALGWEAWSADILPSEVPPHARLNEDWEHDGIAQHYQGDVRDLFSWDHPVNAARKCLAVELDHIDYPETPLWDMTVLHPPCTDLAYAGAVWFKFKDARRGGDGRMQAGADFFMEMMSAPSPLVAVENPHSIIQEPQWAGPPSQTVQPWMFGNGFEKRIDLWTLELPLLVPTHTQADYPELFRVATGGGSWRTDKAAGKRAMSAYEDSEKRVNRARVRSRTFPGLAAAMAAQWGAFAEEYYRA